LKSCLYFLAKRYYYIWNQFADQSHLPIPQFTGPSPWSNGFFHFPLVPRPKPAQQTARARQLRRPPPLAQQSSPQLTSKIPRAGWLVPIFLCYLVLQHTTTASPLRLPSTSTLSAASARSFLRIVFS
jgi:hypothetical protein